MQHLRDLKLKFSNWRANKLTLAEPVPNELWQEVKRALKHISSGLLCRELGITQHQMRLHCNFVGQQPKSNSCCNKFIEITPERSQTSLSQINTIPGFTELEKYEILLVINDQPLTLKLATNNLPAVLRDLKEAL